MLSFYKSLQGGFFCNIVVPFHCGVAHREGNLVRKPGLQCILFPNTDGIGKCRTYIEAGADAILVRSNAASPDEVFAFIDRFRAEISATTPLFVMPTTYPHTTESDIAAAGANVVIYANHLLRAAEPAMKAAAVRILENENGDATPRF